MNLFYEKKIRWLTVTRMVPSPLLLVLLFYGLSHASAVVTPLPGSVETFLKAPAGELTRIAFKLLAPVQGTVTDEKGEPLVGVTIQVKGTNSGTATDAEGKFSIEAPEGATLVVSYIGYNTKEVPLNGQANITIVLQTASTGLNEVVVVGYGTQKKIDLTGAVSAIGPKELENRPITNMSSALQGTMPGVTVTQNNGQPGSDGGTIRIRGIGTLNNSNPMVVVDGVVSSLNDINPDDIASISVLKDAASAAIYGSRAANGVILVTTKKGASGTLTLHYNAYVGKQSPTRLPDFVPSWQAAELYNEVQQNEGRPIKYSEEDIQKFKDGSDPDNYPNTNWLDLLYRGSGIQQNHYIDMSGGTDKTQYMFSLGYYDQEGVVKNSDDKRYSTRLNLTSHIGSRLTVDAKLSYEREVFKEPTNPYTGDFSQIFRQANRIGRVVPYKYSNGYYGYIADGNPIAWLDIGATNNINYHHLSGIADADLEIVKGLHLKPLLGV